MVYHSALDAARYHSLPLHASAMQVEISALLFRTDWKLNANQLLNRTTEARTCLILEEAISAPLPDL